MIMGGRVQVFSATAACRLVATAAPVAAAAIKAADMGGESGGAKRVHTTTMLGGGTIMVWGAIINNLLVNY